MVTIATVCQSKVCLILLLGGICNEAKTISVQLKEKKKILERETTLSEIPIISPRLIFVQKTFLLGLFSGELIIAGDYYLEEFCVSK